jgi:hypothetical protein
MAALDPGVLKARKKRIKKTYKHQKDKSNAPLIGIRIHF